jgi:SHS2 domain-containing protein
VPAPTDGGELPYRWVDHTAELELEIEATTEVAVFAEALAAVAELLGQDDEERGAPGATPERVTRAVELDARDRATLLADWVAELAVLAETEGLVPERAPRLDLGQRHLAAIVEGRVGSPPHVIKGATLHRLSLEPADSGFRATLVLDV